MVDTKRIYILGAGAIGLALAVYLINDGKKATVVQVRKNNPHKEILSISVQLSDGSVIKAPIEMISFSELKDIHGIIVIASKSYANAFISSQIQEKGITSPIVLMQNGIGVENSYMLSGASEIYRCVLYSTSQKNNEHSLRFRSVKASPIGIVRGKEDTLKKVIEQLNTPGFRFCVADNIEEEVWKKAIVNTVFNSICPLLDIDNGIFFRNEKIRDLASEVIDECLQVTKYLGLDINFEMIMQQLLNISQATEGQFISTLQDIRNGRETEIESLNLEIARIAETITPKISLDKTKLLGNLILNKSALHKPHSEAR